jgi:hypothetical protein
MTPDERLSVYECHRAATRGRNTAPRSADFALRTPTGLPT